MQWIWLGIKKLRQAHLVNNKGVGQGALKL